MTDIAHPSVALREVGDAEHTEQTAVAWMAVTGALEGALLRSWPVQYVQLQSGEVIILEARGQRSATGHGKHGLRPDRLAFLRELAHPLWQEAQEGEPPRILLVFFESLTTRFEAWLHDLPEAQPISYGDGADRGSMRFGWHVSEMEKREGPFILPEKVPAPKTRAQEEML